MGAFKVGAAAPWSLTVLGGRGPWLSLPQALVCPSHCPLPRAVSPTRTGSSSSGALAAPVGRGCDHLLPHHRKHPTPGEVVEQQHGHAAWAPDRATEPGAVLLSSDSIHPFPVVSGSAPPLQEASSRVPGAVTNTHLLQSPGSLARTVHLCLEGCAGWGPRPWVCCPLVVGLAEGALAWFPSSAH